MHKANTDDRVRIKTVGSITATMLKLLRVSVAALLCGASCAFVTDTRHARGYPALSRKPTARSYHHEKLVGRQSLATLSMSAVANQEECPGGSCPIPKFRGKLHRNVSASEPKSAPAVSPRATHRQPPSRTSAHLAHTPTTAPRPPPPPLGSQSALILPFAAYKLIKLGAESQSPIALVHAVVFVLSVEVPSPPRRATTIAR